MTASEDVGVSFRDLVDSAPDGVIVCDPQGKIILVNAETQRMFGYTREELVDQSIEILVPIGARPNHAAHVTGYTDAPRLRPMGIGRELTGRRKDGTEVAIEISLAPIRTPQGLFVTAGVRDVSERRALEREFKRASSYLVSAVDSVHDAFALFDEHDRVMMVNSAGRQLFGGTEGNIVGTPFPALLDAALGAGVFDLSNESRDALHQRWVAYHRDPRGTLDVRTGTGRYLRVTETKTAEHGTVSTIADVTDDMQRAEELREAREAAEEASAAKSEFLSSMSHELRTPLNAILGFTQLLERDRKRPLDERQRERLHHVMRGGEHLLRLIDDVLDLSRIEARRMSLSQEAVVVREVLDEVVSTIAPMAERASIAIHIVVTGEIPNVFADRTRLAQILMNFGSNAIKYGRAGGHVTFEVKTRPADLLRIAVKDDGIGIPEDKQDKVFEPFQRAGQEAGPIEGTGIGLTISKRLAELMDGRIGFTSTVGQGSTFWIDLPVHVDAITTKPTTDAGIDPSRFAGPKRHTIVYVEDNPSNIAFMRELMDDLESVELVTAPTAELGLELIRTRRPRLVILDVNLPGMSGIEALARLRADPETAKLPVIGLSAAALLADAKRAKSAGFDRYLTKPVKVDELAAALDELLAD